MSNLDIFTVLDGNVAVWSLLTDHVDWILLVNNWGGLISRTFCKIIFHSIPLCLVRGQKFQILVHSPRISWRGWLKHEFPGAHPGVLSQWAQVGPRSQSVYQTLQVSLYFVPQATLPMCPLPPREGSRCLAACTLCPLPLRGNDSTNLCFPLGTFPLGSCPRAASNHGKSFVWFTRHF